MEYLLTFLYTAKTTITQTNVQMLLEAANLFQIDLLKTKLGCFVAKVSNFYTCGRELTDTSDWSSIVPDNDASLKNMKNLNPMSLIKKVENTLN